MQFWTDVSKRFLHQFTLGLSWPEDAVQISLIVLIARLVAVAGEMGVGHWVTDFVRFDRPDRLTQSKFWRKVADFKSAQLHELEMWELWKFLWKFLIPSSLPTFFYPPAALTGSLVQPPILWRFLAVSPVGSRIDSRTTTTRTRASWERGAALWCALGDICVSTGDAIRWVEVEQIVQQT